MFYCSRSILLVACIGLAWHSPVFAAESEREPSSSDTQLILEAEQFFQKGYFAKASETLDRMEDQEKVPLFRAKILMADKQFRKAEGYYRELLADGHQYQLQLGECLYEQERYREALDVYASVSSKTTEGVWPSYKKLLCELLLEDWLAASQTLKDLPLSEKHPGFYFGQAAYRFAQNKTDEALYFVHSAEQLYDGRDVVRFLQPLFQQLWLLPEESSLQKIK